MTGKDEERTGSSPVAHRPEVVNLAKAKGFAGKSRSGQTLCDQLLAACIFWADRAQTNQSLGQGADRANLIQHKRGIHGLGAEGEMTGRETSKIPP